MYLCCSVEEASLLGVWFLINAIAASFKIPGLIDKEALRFDVDANAICERYQLRYLRYIVEEASIVGVCHLGVSGII